MDHRGAVGDEETRAFLGAGYTPQNALEVVLGVGAYTISTFANRLIDAPSTRRSRPTPGTATTRKSPSDSTTVRTGESHDV